MELTDDLTIEDGMVIGKVATNRVGSECTFEICSVEEWLKMTEEEADKALIDALWESGQVDLYY